MLDRVTAPGASLAYGYDGSLLLSETWSGSVQGDVVWTYDNDFRITNETVRGGHGVTFGYDDDGLLLGAGATTYARYPATGLLQTSTVGGVATTFGYNGFGELTSHATTVGGAPAYASTLGRDAGGRISQQTEVLGGVTTTDVYGYDPAGRLETVTRNGTLVVTYGYDANGNRNAVTMAGGTTSATFDDQDRILTFGTRTYTHTPHGDVAGWTDSATSTTTTLTYDVQGNLRTVQQPGTTITYTVDGRNRRIGTAVNGVPVQGFLWQGQLRPVAELDGTGALVSRFVYGTRINVPEYLVKGGVTYRLLTDHLGSVRLVVDTTTNTVVQALTYDPWGVVVQDTNPGFQPFGYAGGLYDHRTGLVRFGVRDYDAVIGRWLAKDPIGFDGADSNIFVYSGDEPVNHTDVTGLYTGVDDVIFAIGGGIVGLAGQAFSDVLVGELSGVATYGSSVVGGAAGGWALLYVGPIGAGAVGGAAASLSKAVLGVQCFSLSNVAFDSAVGAAGGLVGGRSIAGITSGRGSYASLYSQMTTKLSAGTISAVRALTAVKMFFGRAESTGLYPGTIISAVLGTTVAEIRK